MNSKGSDEPAHAQTHQSLCCSYTGNIDVDESSDQNLDLVLVDTSAMAQVPKSFALVHIYLAPYVFCYNISLMLFFFT